MKAIEIKDLSKSFDQEKTFVLSSINMVLEQGKIAVIVGASGSGKTTLLRLIAGLEMPSSGSICIAQNEVSNAQWVLAPQKRQVGMVFQHFALFPHLTVEQNIGYALPKKDKQASKARVNELLSLIKLDGYNQRYPHELSGGQQQRIALARTLANDPQLLLLDEPFSSLDTLLKTQLRQDIRQIIKTVGITAIFITHDLQDALDIADYIILLEEGQIVEQTALQTILEPSINDSKIRNLLDKMVLNYQKLKKQID
ncbi:MAG: ABC transporter ATP-binding protein [Saprospiraceae bacterium]|nr:ABC transporter ATP-binding protein [Saprospiraceae bacterium]